MASARPAPPMKVTKLGAGAAYVLSSPDGATDWVIVDVHLGKAETRWPNTTAPLDAMRESADNRQDFVEARDGVRVFVPCLHAELGEFGIDPATRMRVR